MVAEFNQRQTRDPISAASLRRHPQRFAELAEAEANLETVETGVLDEVSRMRQTSGRVPWPKALPSFDSFRERWEEQSRIEDVASRAAREKDNELFEANIARDERATDERDERIAARFDRSRAAMTPEQCAAEDATTERLKDAVRRGEIPVRELLARALRK